ncbi:hypothetical protein N0K71_02815 [Dellaglioa algida]|uniref:Metallo-beta-lactamase domain-containing protein n=1 Tax=Dellaglioa algida DSM 15638 TaxID=1423719 RepID=A0A0R1HUY2_9LACO|nr:hypothetical protein [Dellaglioa algida]KRK46535.1 hypothetical protein FC66_GL000158 [Dellaglioa algida DSM 15638]MDK1732548.1 hypothetical protein [Dellaglioa algida]MDK1734064.1 hypothetical protein [Dellaglioa algida]
MTTINLTKNSYGTQLKFERSHSTIQFNVNTVPTEKVTALFLTHFSIDAQEKILSSKLMTDLPIYLSKEAFELRQQLILLGELEKTQLNYKIIPVNIPVIIDGFTITAFLSDSIHTGSLAFLIEDDNHRRAFFTGDTRLNGPHKKRTKKWIRYINQSPLDALILDANYEPNINNYTEITILDHLNKQLKINDLTTITLPNENLHLVYSLTVLAKKLDKIVVLNSKLNHLLAYFYPESRTLLLDSSSIPVIKNNPAKYILINVKDVSDSFTITPENIYVLADYFEDDKNKNALSISSHLSQLDVHDLLNRLSVSPKQLIVMDQNFTDNTVSY